MTPEMNQHPLILIIDGKPDRRQDAVCVLQEHGHFVLAAATGREGLRLAAEHQPELTLVDVVLPDVSGIEVCCRLKADPALAGNLIVLLSTIKTDSPDQTFGLECGADGYITRPTPNREFLARIETFLRLQRALAERDAAIEALQTAHDRLEDKVVERAAQLAQANNELQAEIVMRQRAEDGIRKLNEELEERIEQRTAELTQTSERLELATSAARVGIWDWDVKNDILTWDDTVCALFGITSDDFQGNHAAFLQRLHPEDAGEVDRQILNALNGEKDYTNEFRVVLPDGALRYLRARASITYAPNNNAERMIGVNWDITESKRAELELRLFNEVMVGREDRIIELKEEVNRLAAELGQEAPYPPVWETGGTDWEVA